MYIRNCFVNTWIVRRSCRSTDQHFVSLPTIYRQMKKKNLLKILVILVIFFVQLFVIFSMFAQTGQNDVALPVLLLVVAVLLLGGYRLKNLHQTNLHFEKVGVVIWIPIAALFTYWLNNAVGWGPVLSLGVVGTLGSYLYLFDRQSAYLKEIPPPIYCGAFIGMSSLQVQDVYLIIGLAGLFAAVMYLLTKSILVGVGGKMGTLAFIGFLFSVLLVEWLLR